MKTKMTGGGLENIKSILIASMLLRAPSVVRHWIAQAVMAGGEDYGYEFAALFSGRSK